MRTPSGFMGWVGENPKDTGPDGEAPPTSWAGKCVSLVRRAGEFPLSNTARNAALARQLTERNGHTMQVLQEPPEGWFVYFDGPTSDGHVGMSTGGGNFCSATAFIPGAVGVMPIRDYARKRGVTYRGASPYFVDLTLEPEPEPVAPPKPKATPIMYRSLILPALTTVAYFDGQTYFETPAGGAKDAAWIRFTGAGNPNHITVAEALIYKQTSDEFKAALGGGGGWVPTDAEIVDEAELGQALTSVVQLINDHTDSKFDGLTLTTP